MNEDAEEEAVAAETENGFRTAPEEEVDGAEPANAGSTCADSRARAVESVP